jgi:hypothetical protein
MNIEEGSQAAITQINRLSMILPQAVTNPCPQNMDLEDALNDDESSFEHIANKVLSRYSVGGNPTSPFTPPEQDSRRVNMLSRSFHEKKEVMKATSAFSNLAMSNQSAQIKPWRGSVGGGSQLQPQRVVADIPKEREAESTPRGSSAVSERGVPSMEKSAKY